MYNHFRRAHKNIQRHVALDGNRFSYKEAKFKIIHAEMKGKIFKKKKIDQRKQKGKCQCRQNKKTKTFSEIFLGRISIKLSNYTKFYSLHRSMLSNK